MSIKPNGVLWGALLGGCRFHKNIELAEEAIKHLRKLDPLNDGYYVVISNVYAGAKRLEDATRVRKFMGDQGVKKTPWWSSITVDGKIHEFVAGDETHPQSEDNYQQWNKLLRVKGYVPDTSVILLDIEENEKEKFLCRHSEKLALVFRLMNTPSWNPNSDYEESSCLGRLSFCIETNVRDCWSRDRNRFHCFRDGSCSCGDY